MRSATAIVLAMLLISAAPAAESVRSSAESPLGAAGSAAPACVSRLRAAELLAGAAGSRLETADSPPRAAEFPGLEAIQAADLMKTVEYLASPRLQGRLAGSPGYMAAAREMARRFRRLGLAPGGEDGFLQNLTTEYEEIETCRLALLRPDGSTRPLELGADFTCRGLTGSGDFTAPVVFVGYGLSQPDRGYDDYAGIDAKGKIALALKEPPPFQPDTAGWGGSTLPRPKGRVAAAHGALAMLLVSAPNQAHPQKPIGSMLEGEAEQDERFPRFQVDGRIAEDLVRAEGLRLADLQAQIDSSRAPRSRELAARVRVNVTARYRPKQPSVNVVGILRGSDPGLAGRCLVVGAHLDHVGSQGHEIYFPGANDNASGSAAVLAIAEAFARGGVRPRHSVIFALFSSEESGLFGARRFAARPPVPMDSIVAYFNLDCVGHGDSIEVGGGETWPLLWQLARELDGNGARLMVAETSPGGGADAAPFAEAMVPNLYFASKFSYEYLHLQGDTPATLNPPLLEAIARLAYRAAWNVARGAYSGE